MLVSAMVSLAYACHAIGDISDANTSVGPPLTYILK